jgi:pilus assembly protein Flp/PilA
VKAFAVSENGATAIEYALIAGFVSIVIVTTVTLVGQNVLALFKQLVEKM